MNKDLLWDKYENTKIERAKAEVAQIKARRAADLADDAMSRAIDTERNAAAAWRDAVRPQAGRADEEDGA